MARYEDWDTELPVISIALRVMEFDHNVAEVWLEGKYDKSGKIGKNPRICM